MSQKDRQLLRRIIHQIKPVWWYAMGKVGHECPACQRLFEHRYEYGNPDAHHPHCALADAMRHLNAVDAKIGESIDG